MYTLIWPKSMDFATAGLWKGAFPSELTMFHVDGGEPQRQLGMFFFVFA